jgi:hypothetical protein
MILHNYALEGAFHRAFDARFPYPDKAASSALIARGWLISLNASFCVLEEICRPPRSSTVGAERLKELVSEWAAGPDHPLKGPVLRAASALIEKQPLPWNEGVDLMKHVAQYDGQRAALNIVYFASDWQTTEAEEVLERTSNEVRHAWDAKGV